MDLFVPNEHVNLLEQRLLSLHGGSRARTLVSLAWHLRLRDCARATVLADEAQELIAGRPEQINDRQQLMARLMLVRAEVRLMFADLNAARELTDAATEVFSGIQDFTGQGDALWLQASIASDQGDDDLIEKYLESALALYLRAGEDERALTVQVRMLGNIAYREPAQATAGLRQLFPDESKLSVGLTPWVASMHANVAALTNDLSNSIRFDLEAYRTSLECGQIRMALVCVSNAVESFTLLGDLEAALEWMERGLSLARTTGWPGSLGVCLMQMGDVMRLVGRFDDAKAQLQEALTVMAPLKASRNFELVMFSLGQLAIDTSDFATALSWFEQFEQHTQVRLEPDLIIKSWRGQASALFALGRQQDASAKASMALMMAREHDHAEGQIQTLRILAQLYPQEALGQEGPRTVGGHAVGYLNQALAVASTIKGYTAGADLLAQVAAAHAQLGEFKEAYERLQASNESRQKVRSEEAQKRALAMHVRQQLERVKSEAEYHKQLADTLRETASTLETLGTIGREITASLDAQAVFESLHRHVHQVLDATVFAIYLLDEEQTTLSTAFGIEAGVDLPHRSLDVHHPTSKFALAVRERREVTVDLKPGAVEPNLIPGTMLTLSRLFFPLMVGERLLGAMSVQSPQAQAYGERERAIFRTLCAYGGIALDNARAYSAAFDSQQRADQALADLRQMQSQLVKKNLLLERLSITDQLTGLYNRLQLDRTLEEERLRHVRYEVPVSLLLIDVDLFKSVNDRFGHLVGDQVLIDVARTLQRNVRDVDVVGRWGGEEFLVICRETAGEGALTLAEKLREAVSSSVFESVGSMSVSVGVATFGRDDHVAHVIGRADAALYRAKGAGRNRIESSLRQ